MKKIIFSLSLWALLLVLGASAPHKKQRRTFYGGKAVVTYIKEGTDWADGKWVKVSTVLDDEYIFYTPCHHSSETEAKNRLKEFALIRPRRVEEKNNDVTLSINDISYEIVSCQQDY